MSIPAIPPGSRTIVYALQYMAAALYLAAGVGAVLGLALPAPRILRGARLLEREWEGERAAVIPAPDEDTAGG